MKVKILVEKEVDIKTLHVDAGVRYWEDAEVNGQEDADGTLIPCREGDSWRPVIDVDTGRVLNWRQGTTADIHYKVCDAGTYTLKDQDGNVISSRDGYVPKTMCPNGKGYGDYIIMTIDGNGVIDGWDFDPKGILKERE